MATFDELLGRTPAGNRTAREKPEEVVAGIIKDVEKESVALRLGNVRRMNQFQTRLRVQNSNPDVFWINGTTGAGDAPHGSANNDDTNQVAKDSGLKQTTNLVWDNLYLTPDEIAVMVPMPDSWRDDSDLAWEEVRVALRTAMAKAIDSAVFWGTSTTSHPIPSTFGNGVIPDAIAAGNVTAEGSAGHKDLADSYAAAMQALERRGYRATAGMVDMAEVWRLMRLRSGGPEGFPIYAPSLSAGGPSSIFGRALIEVDNGTFDADEATALFGDFSQLHIGIRQDLTFSMSNTAVIHDASGAVKYNAWQQDGEVLRAVMRLGYVVTDPLMHATGEREYPFQVLVPNAS